MRRNRVHYIDRLCPITFPGNLYARVTIMNGQYLVSFNAFHYSSGCSIHSLRSRSDGEKEIFRGFRANGITIALRLSIQRRRAIRCVREVATNVRHASATGFGVQFHAYQSKVNCRRSQCFPLRKERCVVDEHVFGFLAKCESGRSNWVPFTNHAMANRCCLFRLMVVVLRTSSSFT